MRERFDYYGGIENKCLKAKSRKEINQKLSDFVGSGGKIKRIGRLSFDDLQTRWKALGKFSMRHDKELMKTIIDKNIVSRRD